MTTRSPQRRFLRPSVRPTMRPTMRLTVRLTAATVLTSAGLALTGAAAHDSAPVPAEPASASAATAAPASPSASAPLASAPAASAASAAPAASAPQPEAAAAAHAGSPDGAARAVSRLGLQLLGTASGARQGGNAVLSPFGLTNALGLVYLGADGKTAQEIAQLFSTAPGDAQVLKDEMPALIKTLQQEDDKPFTSANRVWLSSTLAAQPATSYLSRAQDGYGADAVSVDFGKAAAARSAINTWVADQTRQQIKDLLPPGVLTAQTKAVLTNAIHFKSSWAVPFDAARTADRPFKLGDGKGTSKPVPTMAGERTIYTGKLGTADVLALPFANPAYRLVIAQTAEQQSLHDLATQLGSHPTGWKQTALTPVTCELHLPKFKLAPQPQSIKAPLQALGMKQAFTAQADLSPLLGKQAKNAQLDDILYAASVTVDETGAEAAAGTAAIVSVKSLAPAKICAVDRPFVFAIVHAPSGLPLFLGQIADPSGSATKPAP